MITTVDGRLVSPGELRIGRWRAGGAAGSACSLKRKSSHNPGVSPDRQSSPKSTVSSDGQSSQKPHVILDRQSSQEPFVSPDRQLSQILTLEQDAERDN